jgi:hypothetical protein
MKGFGIMPHDDLGLVRQSHGAVGIDIEKGTVGFEATVSDLAERLEQIAADLRAGVHPRAGALETSYGIEVIFDSELPAEPKAA